MAMALHALWPLIAQAKPSSVTLLPVCTVGGVTHYFELKGGDTPLEKRSASQHDHCAFCSFHDGRAAALPSAPWLLVVTGDAAGAPSYFPPAQELPQRHPLARPRAPPPTA
jgi:hypothetical protein